jgi:hypothetical protein
MVKSGSREKKFPARKVEFGVEWSRNGKRVASNRLSAKEIKEIEVLIVWRTFSCIKATYFPPRLLSYVPDSMRSRRVVSLVFYVCVS